MSAVTNVVLFVAVQQLVTSLSVSNNNDDDIADDDDDNDADAAAGDCQEWRTLWIDEAFWHALFAVDLLLIMFVCRPTIKHYRSVTPAHSQTHIHTQTHLVCYLYTHSRTH